MNAACKKGRELKKKKTEVGLSISKITQQGKICQRRQGRSEYFGDG
jgi:hypothetical protein